MWLFPYPTSAFIIALLVDARSAGQIAFRVLAFVAVDARLVVCIQNEADVALAHKRTLCVCAFLDAKIRLVQVTFICQPSGMIRNALETAIKIFRRLTISEKFEGL